VDVLPWSEMDSLQLETGHIKEQLVALNAAGYLTINSQPRVNGAPSCDANVGWGGPNGYVYQKAYVEFFASPANFRALEPRLRAAPAITYMAVDAKQHLLGNVGPADVNAVTWGVFPGKEIIQPTVVDPQSFMVWKDEAFGLWTSEWGSLYEEGSRSRALIEEIASTWYLVSVVDNDFVKGDLFAVLKPVEAASNGTAAH
jgi:methylenetetrahydrofolate reductase (NADPH)